MKNQNSIAQLLIILCLFATSSCIKTNEILSERQAFLLDLSAISAVTLDMPATVNITQGTTQSIRVTAQEEIFDLLNKAVNDENWVIELPSGSYEYESVIIDITLPSISEVRATSTGDITVDGFTNIEQLLLLIDGTGSINFNGEAQTIDLQMEGTGDVELEGSTTVLKINSSGTGSVNAYQMNTEEAVIETSSTGDIAVTVQDLLRVMMSGTGDVSYKGNPVIESTISGTGELIDAN